ncbi:uncharacterized protein LOC128550524 [Mercenaria mercenaria]|uniref:uncharacterized protein LOC128550524 n=1 Tax=Mercenaria mercenaria TaxID=6596 RepID=UPI00234E4EF6|nr:uncharacterized protein LOC128550524 [Mercenaria mercenaria]
MSDDESVTMAKSSRILATPLPSCARVPRQEDDDTRYTKDPTDKKKTKKLQMSEDESVTNGEPAGRSTAMASALPTWIPRQEDNDTGYTKDPIYRQKTKKISEFHITTATSQFYIVNSCRFHVMERITAT